MSPATCILKKKKTDADVEEIAYELDVIRRDIEDSLGAKDAAYIRRVIHFQRALDVAARLAIACSKSRTGWLVGTLSLAYAKSIENMELGHNISHGQWDWMNDPEIHSNTWEWDMVGPSAQWRYSHNYRHHVYSNVLGMDEDIGYRRASGDHRSEVAPGAPGDSAAKPGAGGHVRVGHRAARPALGEAARRAGRVGGEKRKFRAKIGRQAGQGLPVRARR